jgi:hypothetical protein
MSPSVDFNGLCVRLLSFCARITSNSPHVLEWLGFLYATRPTSACRARGSAGAPFAVVEDTRQPGVHRYRLTTSTGDSQSFACVADALAYLEYLLTAAAAGRLGSNLLLHAAVVVANSAALVVPGASGQGKSTLTTALSTSGFRYLSDELGVVDPDSLAVRPFLKPICLKDGGWHALRPSPSLAGALHAMRADGVRVHYLPPPHPCRPSESFPIRYVVIPNRTPGAMVELRPVSRAHTLGELARHSLNLPRHGSRGIDALAAVVESAGCYILTYGDAREAAAIVSKLAGAERPAEAPARNGRSKIPYAA